MVDDDRGESNSSFAGTARIKRLFNRCVMEILRTPGMRGILDDLSIPFTGSGDYTIGTGVQTTDQLVSGSAGTSGTIEFEYLPPHEFRRLLTGYAWTIKSKGVISIFATSLTVLPTTTLTLSHWSKLLVLDADTTTKKAVWANDGDISRLAAEFDDLYVSFANWKIRRREGTVKEWQEARKEFTDGIESLIANGGMSGKPVRAKGAFGHYMAR